MTLGETPVLRRLIVHPFVQDQGTKGIGVVRFELQRALPTAAGNAKNLGFEGLAEADGSEVP
jgi:hypothetical protein